MTHLYGSFGPKEDALFFFASRFARLSGFPRIYISANRFLSLSISSLFSFLSDFNKKVELELDWQKKYNKHSVSHGMLPATQNQVSFSFILSFPDVILSPLLLLI